MNDEVPNCPYCGHTMWLREKKRGKRWDNETRKSTTLYHYYYGCNKCFMRGPLMKTIDDAVEAYEKLVRRTS